VAGVARISPEMFLVGRAGIVFRVSGFGFRVAGCRFRGLGFGFKVEGALPQGEPGHECGKTEMVVAERRDEVSGFGFRVWGLMFQASSFGFRVLRFRFRVSNSRGNVDGVYTGGGYMSRW